MSDWTPFREPFRTTLMRTLSIAIVAGGVVALTTKHPARWPTLALLMLWPSLGGHWIDLLYLNVLRPRLPRGRTLHLLTRVAVWFAGGVVLATGVQLTVGMFAEHASIGWLTWATAGALFVAVELVAHAGLHLRGRPSFYNGLG